MNYLRYPFTVWLAIAWLQVAQCQKIKWGNCTDVFVFEKVPLTCANLSVPLDYTDLKSNKSLGLQLVRVPAVKKPSRGSILFNFGGPGGDGRRELSMLGELLQKSGFPFACMAFLS